MYFKWGCAKIEIHSVHSDEYPTCLEVEQAVLRPATLLLTPCQQPLCHHWLVVLDSRDEKRVRDGEPRCPMPPLSYPGRQRGVGGAKDGIEAGKITGVECTQLVSQCPVHNVHCHGNVAKVAGRGHWQRKGGRGGAQRQEWIKEVFRTTDLQRRCRG